MHFFAEHRDKLPARAMVSWQKLAGQAEGQFEMELSLDEIPRMKESFPGSPAGQELGWVWIQTVREDAGLEVMSVELISRSSDE